MQVLSDNIMQNQNQNFNNNTDLWRRFFHCFWPLAIAFLFDRSFLKLKEKFCAAFWLTAAVHLT
jgi:hypothetical protein